MNKIILFLQSWLKEINPWKNIRILHTNIKDDIIAGITVAIIALPLALAFGEISQLGPEAGIWSGVVGGIIGGLFGGCLVGVSGPTAPMASQMAAFMTFFVIGTTADPDLVAAFSIIFLSGLILVFFSFLRVSRFIHFIPYPVISGFMCGIGTIIVLTQINPFFGLESENNIYEILTNFGFIIKNYKIETLYVSIPSLAILLSWETLQKRYKYLVGIPSPFIALIVGSCIAYFMNLTIPYIGDKMNNIESGNIFTIYIPDFIRFREFIFPALVLAGLAIIDSLLSCKVADNMTGIRHSSDRETFGQGMANMGAGLFGGISTATATTQTVGNIEFGAKTPLATIVKGITLLAILYGLGFMVKSIPNACLAAILFKLGIDILDYRILPYLKKIPSSDLFIFIIAFLVTVFKNIMLAVAIGLVVAILIAFKKIYLTFSSINKHKIIKYENSDFYDGDSKKTDKFHVSVLQPYGPLFFGTTESLILLHSTLPTHNILIVDMKNVTSIDLTGIYILEDFLNNAKGKDIKFFIANCKSDIKNKIDLLIPNKNLRETNFVNSKKEILAHIADV